jgi:hypothetical protein
MLSAEQVAEVRRRALDSNETNLTMYWRHKVVALCDAYDALWVGLRWALQYGTFEASTDNPLHRTAHEEALKAADMWNRSALLTAGGKEADSGKR